MSQFPIILIPSPIKRVKAELPPLPSVPKPEPPKEPKAPTKPIEPVRTDTASVATLGFFGVFILLIAFGTGGNGLGLFVFILLSSFLGFLVYSDANSYPSRQQEYQKQLRWFASKKQIYQEELDALPSRKQQHQRDLGIYNKQIEKLKEECFHPKKVIEPIWDLIHTPNA
ncbi:hypothetical protein H6F89_01715 [Cyanobacteria bacterium FACHB-63]|nr:hypothetical protein [Cyanobacteria bacterium FACHB-63]